MPAWWLRYGAPNRFARAPSQIHTRLPARDPIAWAMDYLRGNVTSLVRIAGYGGLADQLDEAALTAALPGIEQTLRDCAARG